MSPNTRPLSPRSIHQRGEREGTDRVGDGEGEVGGAAALCGGSPTSPRPSPPPGAEMGNREPLRAGPLPLPWCGRGAEVAMGAARFWVVSFVVTVVLLVLTRWLFTNEYFFFAGYVVLQYIVLATAWNILGGYTGYTNFGVGAFFAVGAYSSVVLHKLTALPVPIMILVGGIVSGILGFGMGYLTLRLKGVFFAIATLAFAIVAADLYRQLGFC